MRWVSVFAVCVFLALGCTLSTDEANGTTAMPQERRDAVEAILAAGERPSWCRHYDTWERAVNESERIAARHGDHAPDWPDGVLERWAALNQTYADAARAIWAEAPDEENWATAEAKCDER